MLASLVRLAFRATDFLPFRLFDTTANSRHGGIIVFHRVGDSNGKNRLPEIQASEITPHYLENLVLHLRKSGFTFVSLDTLHQCLTGKNSVSRPISLTFDDGYKDVLTHVYPILKRRRVPFTVYITTRFVDGSLPPWRHLLEESIAATDRYVIDIGERTISRKCSTPHQKLATYKHILSQAEKLPSNDLSQFLSSVCDIHSNQNIEPTLGSYLAWDEVRILAGDPLVTIGAHTVNHPRLSNCLEEEVLREMVESKRNIEEKIGRSVKHFCYPYGTQHDIGSREFRLAKEAGFLTATTSRQAALSSDHCSSDGSLLTQLPRIPGTSFWVNGKPELIDYWFNGAAPTLVTLHSFVSNLFRKSITSIVALMSRV
jgi:peptidoglycan/xylan/chitin deacetylase (PgdA/CDA1 family)